MVTSSAIRGRSSPRICRAGVSSASDPSSTSDSTVSAVKVLVPLARPKRVSIVFGAPAVRSASPMARSAIASPPRRTLNTPEKPVRSGMTASILELPSPADGIRWWGSGALALVPQDEGGGRALLDGGARHDDLVDVFGGGDLEHDRPEDVLEDRTEATCAGLARDREVGDRFERVALELELDPV